MKGIIGIIMILFAVLTCSIVQAENKETEMRPIIISGYANNQTRLSSEMQDRIRIEATNAFKFYPAGSTFRFIVEGQTDRLGTDDKNVTVADGRANAVSGCLKQYFSTSAISIVHKIKTNERQVNVRMFVLAPAVAAQAGSTAANAGLANLDKISLTALALVIMVVAGFFGFFLSKTPTDRPFTILNVTDGRQSGYYLLKSGDAVYIEYDANKNVHITPYHQLSNPDCRLEFANLEQALSVSMRCNRNANFDNQKKELVTNRKVLLAMRPNIETKTRTLSAMAKVVENS